MTKTRRACVELLGSLLATATGLTACRRIREIVGGESRTKDAERPADADWFGFTPYAGARPLCSESVLAFSNGKQIEIHWKTFATRDTADQVMAYYSKGVKGNLEVKGQSLTLSRGNPVQAVLSVDAASAKQYHTCGDLPRPDENTIIGVSQILRP